MTYETLVSLFSAMSRHTYITQCEYAMEVAKEYNMSLATLRRWRKQGFDVTSSKAFGYCKTCNTFFKKSQSHQVICLKRDCHLAHSAYMSRQNGYNRNRHRTKSIMGVNKRNAQRRVSSKRATRSGMPYTDAEIAIVKKSKLGNFDLAISLSRSVSSIEGIKTRLNKEKADEAKVQNNRFTFK